MRTVDSLIDEAVNLCGSQAELARQIGMQPPTLAAMRAGKREVSPETVALLGDVLQLPGSEVQRLAALAIINNPKNRARQEVLRRAFFGYSLAILAGVFGISTRPGESPESMESRPVDNLFIVVHWVWGFFRALPLRGRALVLRT